MKRSVHSLPLCFLLLAVASAVCGQSQDRRTHSPIEADYAIFRTDGGRRAYVEISYALQCEYLTYVPAGTDSAVADVLMRLNVFSDDSLWAADMWRLSHRVAAAESRRGRRIVNLQRLPIQPGVHVAKLFARDLHSSLKSDSLVLTIEHTDSASDELAMSDVLLASSITPEKVATEDVFYRNSLRVIPNPSTIFGDEQAMLFYYVELYNLLNNMGGSTYRTNCHLATSEDMPVPLIKPREQVKPMAESSVEVGAFNVGTLPSGTYFLHFDLLDAEGTRSKSAVKKLFVYNPQSEAKPSQSAEESGASLFANIGDAEISREIDFVRYLYNEAEKEISKKLGTPQAKREFLLQFWRGRRREAAVPWTELRNRYLQAVAFVNANFRSFYTEGWRTDRGRVYLVYGKPDDIERYPSTDEAKPHEVWTYNSIEGGVEFVFGDRTGLREFQLLHSTKLGEVKNENWRALISEFR